ncbi:MAG: glycoside hydrolase family 2 protein, partial [Planctomycetota bacterium]
MLRSISVRWWSILFVISLFVLGGCLAESKIGSKDTSPRRIIDLNGTWEVAQGSMDSLPDSFQHKVPVPGLVDMARPAFEEVGKKSEKREAFWYRRTFTVKGKIPDVAILKIQKAKYGTKVFLNGELVGEHLPCFTPALLDVKKFLKGSGRENELIVRVGADRESMPKDMPGGWDFEKYLYIPGIYDSVELILTGKPFIANVQTVPNISENKVQVVTEVQGPVGSGYGSISYEVTEVRTGKLVGTVESRSIAFSVGTTKLKASIPIENCKLWTPENPFLYELKLSTGEDCVRIRFGMRSFRFDKESGRAVLNGKPYIMRGTNVCVYRFFEDAERGDKPWRREWVRRLHRKFKSMHWNSIRYCIGFPPELWYEIADEEGFLIQDEFPIWLLSKAPENPKSEKIIPEYTEWMRERWNHACVVIWDAQNESVTP